MSSVPGLEITDPMRCAARPSGHPKGCGRLIPGLASELLRDGPGADETRLVGQDDRLRAIPQA